MKFSLEIPLNELPDKIGELPKNKIILCACLMTLDQILPASICLLKVLIQKFW